MRWLAFAVVVLALSACGNSVHLPTLGGAVRPAWWSNGDGSWVVGGLDGTGHPQARGAVTGAHVAAVTFGHIQWASWTRTEAVGWGIGWDRCFDFRGCPLAYTRDLKGGIVRLVATDPVAGTFRHLRITPTPGARGGSWCVVYPMSVDEFVPAKCSNWKPTS